MFRKALALTAIVLAFAASNLQAEQISCSWVGGEEGLWGDPCNWDCQDCIGDPVPGVVPDNNDSQNFVVTINAGEGLAEVGLEQDYTISTLHCYGNVELERVAGAGTWPALTLEKTQGLTNYGYLELEEIGMEGNVTNTDGATLSFEGNWIEIMGNLYNMAGGMVKAESLAEIKEGVINNAGSMVVYHAGTLLYENHISSSGEIKLIGGMLFYFEEEGGQGLIDNEATGIITGFGIVQANQSIKNEGKIHARAGSLFVQSRGTVANMGTMTNNVGAALFVEANVADVNNQGTIEVNSDGSVVFDCNLVNVADANIYLRGGTLAATTITQTADANFAGFGGITVDDEILIESGAKIKLTGPTNIVSDVNIPENATLEISDGTTLITGDCECNYGTIHMKGGRIIIQGVFTNNNCHIIWEPGIYTNVADFNLDGTVNFKDFADFANTWLWQASWR